jgi:hypothetical protein
LGASPWQDDDDVPEQGEVGCFAGTYSTISIK